MCCPDKTSGGGTSSASSGSNQRGRAPRDHELETFGNGGFHGNSQDPSVLSPTVTDHNSPLSMFNEWMYKKWMYKKWMYNEWMSRCTISGVGVQ